MRRKKKINVNSSANDDTNPKLRESSRISDTKKVNFNIEKKYNKALDKDYLSERKKEKLRYLFLEGDHRANYHE